MQMQCGVGRVKPLFVNTQTLRFSWLLSIDGRRFCILLYTCHKHQRVFTTRMHFRREERESARHENWNVGHLQKSKSWWKFCMWGILPWATNKMVHYYYFVSSYLGANKGKRESILSFDGHFGGGRNKIYSR